MKTILYSLLISSCLAVGWTGLHAATVSLVHSELFTGDNTNRSTHTHTFAQEASTNTVLLMAITGHDLGDGITATYDVGGTDQAMTQLGGLSVSGGGALDGDNAFATIFAIELGSVSEVVGVDISWSLDSGTDRGTASFFQLSDATLTGALTDADTSVGVSPISTTVSFTGLSAGSFVLSGTAANNNSSGITSFTGTPTDPGFTFTADEGAYNNGLAYSLDVSGDVSITTGNNGTREFAMSGIAIAAIPEPGTLALVGIAFGVMVVSNRRRL